MRSAYWNERRFVLAPDDPDVGCYLYVYKDGVCERDYLQDTEQQAMKQAVKDYDVAFSLWHEEVLLPKDDRTRAYRDFLGEIKPLLAGKGVDDIYRVWEGVIVPEMRVLPLPDLLRYIESNCHVRAWGDRYVEGMGWDWLTLIGKVQRWSQKLQAKTKNLS